MYFDAVLVEVKKNLLLYRLALPILCSWLLDSMSNFVWKAKVRKRKKKPTAEQREVHDCCRLLAGPPPLLVVCKIFLVKTIVSKIPDLVELKED